MAISGATIAPARRPSSRVGLLVVLTFILAAISPLSFALTYEPLQRGSAYGLLAGSGGSDDLKTVEDVERPLDYRNGETLAYFLSIRNTGIVGLDVTDLPNDAESLGLFESEDVLVVTATEETGPIYERAEPFEPFHLDAGEERTVIIRGHFAHCSYYPAGAVSELSTQHIRFRVFGITKSAGIRLPAPLQVTSPADEDCPLPRR